MIQPLIPSRSNTSSARVLYFPSFSTTSFPLLKSCGRFLFSSNPLLFYLNSSCFNGQGRQRQLRRITWPRLESIGPFTFPIGSIGTQVSPFIEYHDSDSSSCVTSVISQREPLTLLPLPPVSSRQDYTSTSFMYTLQSTFLSLSITVIMIHSIRVLQGQKFELPA